MGCLLLRSLSRHPRLPSSPTGRGRLTFESPLCQKWGPAKTLDFVTKRRSKKARSVLGIQNGATRTLLRHGGEGGIRSASFGRFHAMFTCLLRPPGAAGSRSNPNPCQKKTHTSCESFFGGEGGIRSAPFGRFHAMFACLLRSPGAAGSRSNPSHAKTKSPPAVSFCFGGEGGIRTHVPVPRQTHFECAPL